MAKRNGGSWTGGGERVPRMWMHAIDDAVLVPEPALPAQVYHLWHNSRALRPERALALAVLVQAVLDVQRFQGSGMAHHRRLHDQAWNWIDSNARDWPFAFVNLCDAFGLEADEVRVSLRTPRENPARQAA
ncbi:MAG: hypothetical protein U0802_05315 [Candidatus Binatia bacterium]